MKISVPINICLFFIFLSSFLPGLAQLTDWAEQQNYILINNDGIDRGDHAYLLEINTQQLISNNQMLPDGADIRFALDCEGLNEIPFYIEGGMNTSSTLIWVYMPSILAGEQDTAYMFYNNPGATPASNFDATFRSQLRIETTDTLTGLIADSVWEYDYIYIAEDVLVKFDPTLARPWRLRMDASKIVIAGELNGQGMGYDGVVMGDGNGPGGGTQEITGGGGGAYGGDGGNGSYGSSPSSRGVGGSAYGTLDGKDIQAGSAGGAAGLVGGGNPGANGGMSFSIRCEQFNLSGTISARGDNGLDTRTSYSPGGGAGGGVLVVAEHMNISGTIDVIGGDGGDSDVLYYAGGGAGGGRIKLFSSKSYSNTGTMLTRGGYKGFGGITDAEPGDDGTFYEDPADIPFMNISSIVVPVLSTVETLPICENNALTINATPGLENYTFFIDGMEVQTGASNTFIHANPKNGEEIVVKAGTPPCAVESTPLIITTLNNDPPSIMGPSSGGFCAGQLTTLSSSIVDGTFYQWQLEGNDLANDTLPQISVGTSGNYSLRMVNRFGCTSQSDSLFLNSFPIPSNGFSTTTSSFCEGESSTHFNNTDPGESSHWMLDNEVFLVNESVTLTNSGDYGVYVQSSDGCISDTVNFNIVVNPLPASNISTANGGTTICPNSTLEILSSQVTGSYAWYRDGNLLQGAVNNSLIVAVPGEFYYTIEDDQGCSAESAPITITPFGPHELNSTGGSLGFCPGDSILLGTADLEGVVYSWHVDGTPLPSSDQSEIWISTPGNYEVALDNGSCISTTEAISISQYPSPVGTLDPSGPQAICEGESMTLSVVTDSENTIQWLALSQGDLNHSNESITLTEADWYFAHISNTDGCSIATDSVNLVVNPLPEKPIITHVDSVMWSNIPEGNQWYYAGTELTGETNDSLFVSEAGYYYSIVTNEFGCTGEASDSIGYFPIGIRDLALNGIQIISSQPGTIQIFGTPQLELNIFDLQGKLWSHAFYEEGSFIRLPVPGLLILEIKEGKQGGIHYVKWLNQP